MCRNYELETPLAILKSLYGAEFPEFNGKLFRTAHRVPAVRMRDGQREAALLRWGLIPPWAKDEREGSSKVNARAETVATLNSFRTPFKKRRCLLPASAFWEFREITKAQTEPHRITMADGSSFAFAGLWEVWKSEGQPTIESCSMITTEPNSLIAQFHDRMPVILPQQVWDQWLSSTEDVNELLPLLASYPSELMHEEIAQSPLKTEKPPKEAKRPKKEKPPEVNKQKSLFE